MTILLDFPPPMMVAPSIWLIWDVVKVMYFVFFVGGDDSSDSLKPLRTMFTGLVLIGSSLTSCRLSDWFKIRGADEFLWTCNTFWPEPDDELELSTRTTWTFLLVLGEDERTLIAPEDEGLPDSTLLMEMFDWFFSTFTFPGDVTIIWPELAKIKCSLASNTNRIGKCKLTLNDILLRLRCFLVSYFKWNRTAIGIDDNISSVFSFCHWGFTQSQCLHTRSWNFNSIHLNSPILCEDAMTMVLVCLYNSSLLIVLCLQLVIDW